MKCKGDIQLGTNCGSCQRCQELGWVKGRDPYQITFNGAKIDPYRVCRLFKITDPAIQQAVKKLLRCGQKHKTPEEDVAEAITSLQRWQEMQKEEAMQGAPENQPIE